MKGSSYSLRVMKNARQHKQQQAAAAAANAAHGTLLEVPTELERSNSSVSTTKITEIICFLKNLKV